ncbi:MAG: hypothetical protein AAFQ80_04360 [Cyanobacteria bacterium J06621_8]
MTSTFIVRGQVLSATETPLANLIVRAYDRDLRTEQLLGEKTTSEDGSYEISYNPEQFRRGDKQNAEQKYHLPPQRKQSHKYHKIFK